MVSRRGIVLKSFLSLLAFAGVVYASSSWWLTGIGWALIYDQGPGRAETALVLAGDGSGSRATAAAELVKRGLVRTVIVSGPPGYYGINEADAAIRYLVQKGYCKDCLVPVYHTAMSTRDEAEVLLDELQRRQIHSFILVTSNYHTGRAHRLFAAALRRRPGLTMRVMGTPDHDYDPASWWKTRQGRKMAFFEWTKTVTSMVGI